MGTKINSGISFFVMLLLWAAFSSCEQDAIVENNEQPAASHSERELHKKYSYDFKNSSKAIRSGRDLSQCITKAMVQSDFRIVLWNGNGDKKSFQMGNSPASEFGIMETYSFPDTETPFFESGIVRYGIISKNPMPSDVFINEAYWYVLSPVDCEIYPFICVGGVAPDKAEVTTSFDKVVKFKKGERVKLFENVQKTHRDSFFAHMFYISKCRDVVDFDIE